MMKNNRRFFVLLTFVSAIFALATTHSCLAAKKRALLIGINDYGHPQRNLNGCVNDCEAFQEKLLNSNFGFKRQDIATLFNRDATLDNILKTFSEFLVKGTQPGDLVVLYYSGHGSRSFDRSGDEADHFDEGLVPVDCIGNTGENFLVDDLISQYFSFLRDREFIAIFDSCHSGSANRNLTTFGSRVKFCEVKSSLEVRNATLNEFHPSRYGLPLIEKLPESETNVFFSASRDIEPSLEIRTNAGVARGAFTLSFLKGLSGSADQNRDGKITYRELFEYSQVDVKNGGLTQIPQLEPSTSAPNAAILDRPAFRADPVGMAQIRPTPPKPLIGPVKPSIEIKPPKPNPPISKPPVSPPSKPSVKPAIPAAPPKPVDLAHLFVFLKLDFDSRTKKVLSSVPYLKFCENPNQRDVTLSIRKDAGKLVASVFDLSDLETNRIGDATIEGLAKKVAPILEGLFLQKKLGNLVAPESAFRVKLDVVGGARKFKKGEKVVYSFSTSRDCYLYLINVQTDGRVNLLFPNPFRKGNLLKTGSYLLPDKSDRFDFEISEPFGNELVKAIGIIDKDEAKKLGLPVPGDDFITFDGNPFTETSKSREFITSVESDVEQIGANSINANKPQISLSQVSYLTREMD